MLQCWSFLINTYPNQQPRALSLELCGHLTIFYSFCTSAISCLTLEDYLSPFNHVAEATDHITIRSAGWRASV